MKWYYYILLIIVFSGLFYLFGVYVGRNNGSKKASEPAPIAFIKQGTDAKVKNLSDSIIKLNYRLQWLNKSLVKALGFKPALHKNDTARAIVAAIKTDTAKIAYLQTSLIKSLNAYSVCGQENDAKDSLISQLLNNISQKDSIAAKLATDNNFLSQSVKDEKKTSKLFKITTGTGLLSIIGILIL